MGQFWIPTVWLLVILLLIPTVNFPQFYFLFVYREFFRILKLLSTDQMNVDFVCLTEQSTDRSNSNSEGNKKPVQWFISESLSGSSSSSSESGNGNVGMEVYGSGGTYEGEFRNGKANGNGVHSFYVNGRYEGVWIKGKYDGFGIESWAKGSKYRGEYVQGLRHGFGVYKFYTGDCYAGQWFNGQSHGVGVQYCADGSSYVGQFKCGVKQLQYLKAVPVPHRFNE